MDSEVNRLNKLKSYGILDTPSSKNFDDITKIVSQVFEVPICLVSLVDKDRQWFKSKLGLDVFQTSICDSFCAHAIKNPQEVMVVNDALLHSDFKDNPLVIGEPRIRFYAGAPIVDSEGYALGTVCIIDKIPRSFSQSQGRCLKSFADLVMNSISDYAEQKKLEYFLKEKNIYKDSILDSSNFSFFSTDEKGIIKTFSKGASDLLGYSKAEVLNKITPVLFHENSELLEELSNSLYQEEKSTNNLFISLVYSLKTKNFYEKEWTYITKEGRRVPVQLNISPIKNNSEISGYVFIAKDLTFEKREFETMELCRSLENVVEELKNAIKVKSEFFATMSHEIRTPLTSIISLASLLHDEVESESLKTDIEEIRYAAEHLKGILTAILDFAKIESGNLGLIEDAYNTDYVINEILKVVGKYSRERNIVLNKEISKTLPENLYIDLKKVLYVSENIISNAFKFSDDLVTLDIAISVEENNFIISISDKGIGISDENFELIFKPYIQIDGSLSRKVGGLGLGLPLSRALVNLMGGDIYVSSNIDKGVTFEFFIPLNDPCSGSPKLDQKIASVNIEGKKILFADDNNINRNAIKKTLENMGFNVAEAIDGIEVLHKVKQEKFDVILLDIHMPNMDGIQALERLVKEDLLLNTPVLMLSACVIQKDIDYAMNLGAKGFISKPIEYDELELKLKSVFCGN